MTYAGRVEAQFSVPTGMSVVATNGAGTPKTVPILAGSFYLSSFIDVLTQQLNAYSDSNQWSVSLDTTANGTGCVTVNCTGTFSLTLPLEVSELLGDLFSFAAVTTPQLGTTGPIGVFFPDASLTIAGDPAIAPVMSDLRATRGPTGVVVGLGGGNRQFVHQNVGWKMVPKNRVWTDLETTVNNSWQSFVTETQQGQGTSAIASWFRLQALVRIYGLDNNQVGTQLDNGWSMIGVDAIAPPLSKPPWTAYYDIIIPTIVSATTS